MVLTSTHNLCFEQKYENILSKNFQFLVMKFSIYLNRRVFVKENYQHWQWKMQNPRPPCASVGFLKFTSTIYDHFGFFLCSFTKYSGIASYFSLWHTTSIFFWLCWGLSTRQPLWVILCCLPEKGRKSNRRDSRRDEREEQGRKRKRNESEQKK